MKKDVLTIGLIVLIIGLPMWFGILRSIDPVYEWKEGNTTTRTTVALFEIAGFIVTLIGIPIVLYGAISKPRESPKAG